MANPLSLRVHPVFSLVVTPILQAGQFFASPQELVVTYFAVATLAIKPLNFGVLRLQRLEFKSVPLLLPYYALIGSNRGLFRTDGLSLRFEIAANHIPPVSQDLILLHQHKSLPLLSFHLLLH